MSGEEHQDSIIGRIRQLSNEELVKMVGEDANEYRQDALQFAEAELAARGIELEEKNAWTQEEERTANNKIFTDSISDCLVCGGTMRAASLYAQEEVTLMFKDNLEERFIDILACSRCGRVQLLVDYETEVEE